LLRVLRVKDASIRATAWTAMLCGSLMIPPLTAVLPKTLLPTVRPALPDIAVRLVEAPAVVYPAVIYPAVVHEVAAAPKPTRERPGSRSAYDRVAQPASPVAKPFDWALAAEV